VISGATVGKAGTHGYPSQVNRRVAAPADNFPSNRFAVVRIVLSALRVRAVENRLPLASVAFPAGNLPLSPYGRRTCPQQQILAVFG